MPLDLSRPATATGIGSVPGTDPRLAATRVSDQLPELPHVPELPQRGPGADMIGRTLGLLRSVSADFAASTTPTGWQLSAPGVDMRRAEAYLREDLEAVEEVWHGHTGPAKQQLAGPWTLAVAVERAGRPLLADPGALRELVEAWAVMAAAHRADLERRVPARWLLQMDEPSLPAVVNGSVATASGMANYPAIAVSQIRQTGADLVHCCAGPVPYHCLTGIGAVLVDWSVHRRSEDADLAVLAETGSTLGFGVPGEQASVRTVLEFHERTGLRPQPLLVTPPCGLVADYRPWQRLAADLCDRLAA